MKNSLLMLKLEEKTAILKRLSQQLKITTENKYSKHYEELIEMNKKRMKEMSDKLNTIKNKIPDFNEETFEKYAEYYVTKSEIYSISKEIEKLREVGLQMKERSEHLSQQIEETKVEIESLENEIKNQESDV